MNPFKKSSNPINTTKEKRFLLNIFGEKLVDIFKRREVVLAGGSLTSLFSRTEINDFDLFVKDDVTYHIVCNEIEQLSNRVSTFKGPAKNQSHAELLFESENAKTFKVKVDDEIELRRILCSYGIGFNLVLNKNHIQIQVVNPLMSSTTNLFDRFDFTVCMASFDFKTEEFEFDPRFLVDVARKELHYNPNCGCPFGAIFRVKKYNDKGFTAPPSELLKIIISSYKVKILTWKEFINELIVVPDTQLNSHIEGIVSEIDEDGEFDIETALEWIEDFNLNGVYVPGKYKKRIVSAG